MNFTTEKRRELTASILESSNTIDQTEQAKPHINSAYGQRVVEDKTNRELYRTINSQLSGLAYEYGVMTGYYHPMLLEKEYPYVEANDDMSEFTNKTYWDSPKLQDAGALKEGNEFHLNLSVSTTEVYPTHPIKYGRWVNDSHSEVSTFSPTEQELWDAIRSMVVWYNSGGSSGSTELTIFGEYREFEMGVSDSKQRYMTVGYTEYQVGGGGFMDDGYNPNGDFILINPTDNQNFAFGKIIASRTEPSRILFVPFCKRGTIQDNAPITSTYTSGNAIYIEIIVEMLNRLYEMYGTIHRFLSVNPNGEDTDNLSIKQSMVTYRADIDLWKETKDITTVNSLISSLETNRTGIYVSRQLYINTTLTNADELYSDRFKIIDMRLSKRMGTLSEIMKSEKGIGIIEQVTEDRKDQLNWMKKYFIVKKCAIDGDWKRRVFIDDPIGEFQIGDEVYLLTDDENVPEIKATIDIIVSARLQDATRTKFDEETGEVNKAYYPVKKIFFRDAWKNGEVKLIRYFSNDYKIEDNFRIIKQVV